MKGFHLIEILIVVSMMSVLAALSFPLYSQYIVHERRLEAAGMLSNLGIAMEQYAILHNTYQGATLAALNVPELIVKNHYQLSIVSATDHDYFLSAKPLTNQAEQDQACATLTLRSTGEKGTTGPGRIDECW